MALIADGIERDARRDPHDRADPRARRARLRGRGRRHRRRRRPAPARRRRARGPLLRRDDARRPGPARPGRDPGRGPLRPDPRHRAGPGRGRRDPAQPDHRDAAGRQLPHRAGRLRRPAQRRRRPRGDGPDGAGRLLRGALAGPLAEPGGGPLAARRSASTRRGSGAGSAASTSPASTPARPTATPIPGELKVLYAGRLTREKGVDLLAESFLRAHRADPRLHLLLAGGGPEEGELRARLGERATFLGWLEGEELARAYASADIFLFCSRTDTYGQVVARGRRQRPAGRRGRRGRPRLAGREPPHRDALPARRRPPRRRRPAARLLAAAAPPPRRLRRPRRPRALLGARAGAARRRLPARARR